MMKLFFKKYVLNDTSIMFKNGEKKILNLQDYNPYLLKLNINLKSSMTIYNTF